MQVVYQDNKYGMVKPSLLDELITTRKIKQFLRSEGWATVGIDPMRGTGGYYSGPERRNTPLLELMNRTKKQLITELLEIRQRVIELEASAIAHREVAQVLQESEQRFRQVAESSGEFIWEVDANGLYTYANPVVEEMLGYRPEELIGKKHFYDFFDPDMRDTLKKTAFEVFAKKATFRNFINPNVHKNGNKAILETSGSPILDNKGNLLGYRGSDKDITERKKAEDALRISEEKFRTVADFTYDWEDWLDPDGKYIYVSPSCEWISGYTPDEFIADPDLVLKITHPDDRDLVTKHFHETLHGSIHVHDIDFRIITRSGETRWISHYCQLAYGKDGNFLGRRGSSRDITKRKEKEKELRQLTDKLKRFNVELLAMNDQLESEIGARLKTEKALRESEERYKKMVDAVTAYTYSVDLSRSGEIFTQHSEGCIPITGYSPKDYESDHYLWHKMIYPDDQTMIENLINRILSDHKVPPIEHRIIRRDGMVVWVRNTVVPHCDVDGRLTRYDGMIEDITARKLAEQKIQKLNEELEQKVSELMEANRELEAFNRSVSHDLQTPLLVIGGFTRRLLKVYGDNLNMEAIDAINTIQMSAQKMERLIKDLLAFSRSGRQEIRIEKIDMRKLVTTVLDELKPLLEGRRINFDIKALPSSYGDTQLMKQVLINLLSNAIKFTQSKDVAITELGSKVEENETIYYVKDNGIGFDFQYTDKLFSPFYRLPEAKEFEGTGIGLSIVQRIINRHGGRVWAEGKVNEGATFYFSLPRKGSDIS